MTTISPKNLSILLVLDESNIRKYAREGIIIRAAEKGLYVLEQSVQNYVVHQRESAAGRGDKSLNEESALLKRAQRHNYDLKNAVLEASAVRIEDIHPAWSRVILAVRSAILAIPTIARMRLQLSERDATGLTEIIREQLTAASLTDIPPMIEVGAADPRE
jgi:phage terminase Nu1 subunit (DNA packaging protein)